MMQEKRRERDTPPAWSPGASWDNERSLWVVRPDELSGRGELEVGGCVLLAGLDGLTICRGGGLDTPAAYGLYMARRGGLSLHWDGRWRESLLAPGVARPRSALSLPDREAFTGIWDSLEILLRRILDDHARSVRH